MNDKIRNLLQKYEEEIAFLSIPPKRIEDQCGDLCVKNLSDSVDRLKHIRWMLQEILSKAEPDNWSDITLNRWIGFIQAIIWSEKFYGILELRDQTRNLYD